MTAPALVIDGVSAAYGSVVALRDICLTMPEGSFTSLIGANGAGKSTLMSVLSGLLPPRLGSVAAWGHSITHAPCVERLRLGMALVPEGRRVFARMSVYENLCMGTLERGKETFKQNIDRMFALFPILQKRAQQRAGTLSGGEQQMLALARALMSNPRLLMLDEPSLGLAPLIVRQLFDILRDLHRTQGTTILLAEQNAAAALSIATTGVVLVNGVITRIDDAGILLRDPAVRHAYLGESHAV